jgi:regulator of sigma E protease
MGAKAPSWIGGSRLRRLDSHPGYGGSVNVVQVLIGALAMVAVFLVLVVPHETGHFALAKLFRIKVHEYSIGFGTKLASFVRDGTQYSLRAIPVLAYVRLGGMEPGEFDDPNGFHRRPHHQRLLVLIAGPAANFLTAMLLMTVFWLTQLNSDPGKITVVTANSPAAASGLRAADSIQTVNGRPQIPGTDLATVESAHPGQPVTLTVRRPDGSVFTSRIQPTFDRTGNRFLIGISIQPVVTPLDVIVNGVTFPVVATAIIGKGTAQLFTGQINPLGRDGVTGVIGVGAVTYQTANTGGLLQLAVLAAVLSMAIGLTNLLPIPALDGGRIVVVLVEALRGRPFDRERELAVQRAALMALLAVMVLLAFLDIQRVSTGVFTGLK